MDHFGFCLSHELAYGSEKLFLILSGNLHFDQLVILKCLISCFDNRVRNTFFAEPDDRGEVVGFAAEK